MWIAKDYTIPNPRAPG